jgi:hypothetical protein
MALNRISLATRLEEVLDRANGATSGRRTGTDGGETTPLAEATPPEPATVLEFRRQGEG